MSRRLRFDKLLFPLAVLGVASFSVVASADDTTPGYPERVLQWSVQEGETCADIAVSLYGSVRHLALLHRYNDIECKAGAPIGEGAVLVVPEKVTTLPTARLRSMTPTVKARPPGASWAAAAPGMPLYRKYSVNTLEHARADIRFQDRTRVYLAEHTLVVIYGTASETGVSKTKPAAVELDSGELQAGLAALRGKPVEVATKGGGRVSAASRDATLRRKGQRTTVSVFDGHANVRSAGSTVRVPTNHGSSFVRAKPPTPPRPLPPPPSWEEGSSPALELAPGGVGILRARWNVVPRAVAYRIEVAKDPAFVDLLVREETPPDVRSFRAEKLPPGDYYVRVRAIDDEDFLGISSSARAVALLAMSLDRGDVRGGRITANPYSMLELSRNARFEMAVDDGQFGVIPKRIDLARTRPAKLRFRRRGGSTAPQEVAVDYTAVSADVAATLTGGGSAQIAVTLKGLEGIDVPQRVAPALRIESSSGVTTTALVPAAAGSYTAALAGLPEDDEVRLDVIDAHGRVLGSASVDSGPEPAAPEAPPSRRPWVGPTAPARSISPLSNVPWWAPTPRSAAMATGLADLADGEAIGQGSATASAAVGALGLRAHLSSNRIGDSRAVDDGAWLGATWRLMGHRAPSPELGVGLQVALPTTPGGPPLRFEPSVALGAVDGRATWLVNVGARVAAEEDTDRMPVPDVHPFLVAGATYDLASALRGSGWIDGHVYFDDATDPRARGGLSLALEAGTTWFGGITARVSPWDDAGGHLSGALTLGVREP